MYRANLNMPITTDCKPQGLINILIKVNQYGWWNGELMFSFFIFNEPTFSQYSSDQPEA